MTAEGEGADRFTVQLARILDNIRREATDTNPRTYAVGTRCPECCGRGWEPGPTIPDCLYPPTVDCEACGGTGKVGGRRDELAARRRPDPSSAPPVDTSPIGPSSEPSRTVADRRGHESQEQRRVHEIVKALDDLGVPTDASLRTCRLALADAGYRGSQDVVSRAYRVRNKPHGPQPPQPQLPLIVADRRGHEPPPSHGDTPTSPSPPVNRINRASKPGPASGVAPRKLQPG